MSGINNNNKKYLLVELLQEDQEPFNLNNYVSDRRRRRRNIQVNNNNKPHPKHDHVGSISKLSDFLSCPSTTTRRTGSVFLNIPVPAARTSASLLSKTSILRIKRRYSKPRKQMNYIGVVGLVSSLVKKLTIKDGDLQSKKMEFSVEEEEGEESSGRRSSTCPSTSRKSFGWSPLSPFKLSSARRSPVSSSSPPIASPPSRRKVQENHKVKKNSKRYINKKEEKEEKEESTTTTTSPVSVLDRPSFENEKGEDEDEDQDHHPRYKSSFYKLHSAKEEELLNKLRRFEKHVNLDPIELLEKTVVQQLYNYHNETEESPDNNQQTYDYELEENDYDILLGGLQLANNKMEYYYLAEEEKEESTTNNIDHHMIDQMVLMVNDQLMKNQWTRYDLEEETEETGMLIEVAIFSLLVEELAVDLITNRPGDRIPY